MFGVLDAADIVPKPAIPSISVDHIAAWVKDGKKGQFFSVKASPITVKKKEEKDDIPF